MSAVGFTRDGAALRGVDAGAGLPVLFQHGLGGSEAQVAEVMPELPNVRRLTLECRAHGGSAAGGTRPFGFPLFADDLLAFCDDRGVGRLVAGGISMGAALALRLAVRHPERVRGLVLARPAWLFAPGPDNLAPYRAVAAALRAAPAADAKAAFAGSPIAAALARAAPDNLATLLGFFDRPDPALTADLLDDVARDGPGVTGAEAAALRVPTLVIGHGVDHAHPLALAAELARAIPGAELVEIPPKATDKPGYVTAFRAAVTRFLHTIQTATEF